jgi:hypothetical protein
MGLTIYVRLSNEEAELVRAIVPQGQHNKWAKGVLLREAEREALIPLAEIDTALKQFGFSDEQRARVLARFK